MKKHILTAWSTLNLLRSIPAIFVYNISPSKSVIDKDISRWAELVLKEPTEGNNWKYLHKLMLNYPQFRNLFYHRILKSNLILGMVIQPFYPKLNSLDLHTKDIGAGFVIYHGFSTIVYAKSIGENCSVGQQVTVGMVRDIPTIEDNVQITAGAFVVGGITVGENSIVGANATVTKDVPANCVVVGNPAFIVRENGIKTHKSL